MMQTPLVTSWSAGELSPKMYGRVDLDAFFKGAKTIENFFVLPQGPLTKRPGTVHLGSTKGGTARLIPFVVSDDVSYLLELGNTGTSNGYIRVWRDGVYRSVDIATTWTAAQIAEIQYCQDNNGIYFAHDSHKPSALIYTALDTFQYGNIAWQYDTGGTEPFASSSNYPRAIAIFGGRFWFGGTINNPQTVWGSEAFGYSEAGGALTVDMRTYTTYTYSYYQMVDPDSWANPTIPERELMTEDRDITTPDHAIEMTIASDENDVISWLAAGRALIVGTTSSEWVITKDVTAVSPRAERMTDYGSANIQARMAGDAVLLVQGDKKRVREYRYTQDSNGYTSPDLTLLADHIAGTGFVDFAKQRNPYPALCFVRSDGTLAVLTYDRSTQTAAWQRWVHADGLFQSVAIVKEDSVDTIYVVVYRNSDYYIEKFADVFPDSQSDIVYMDAAYDAGTGGDSPTCAWLANETVSVVVDGVYVDDDTDLTVDSVTSSTIVCVEDINGNVPASGNIQVEIAGVLTTYAYTSYASKTFSGVTPDPTGDISGGEAIKAPVTVIADGSGVIDLTDAIHTGTQVWVGLPYTAKYQSMPSPAVRASGSAQGQYKRISAVYLRVYRTMDIKAGFDTWTAAGADTYELGDVWVTDDIQVPFNGDYDLQACINIFSDLPLPCTISLIVTEVVA